MKNEVTISSAKKSNLKSVGKTKNAGKGAKRSLKLMKKKSDKVKKGMYSDEDSSDDADLEVLQQLEKDIKQSDDSVSDIEEDETHCPHIGDLQIDDHILVKFTGKFYMEEKREYLHQVLGSKGEVLRSAPNPFQV